MAKQVNSSGGECPVARSLDLIGDRWSLLIIRDAFDGLSRFGQFQKSLGLAKNILAARLRNLVATGVFEIVAAADGSAYHEYALTAKGRSVFPVVIGLRQWGEAHLFAAGETHSILVDNQSGQPIRKLEILAQDGRRLAPADCHRRKKVKRA